MTSLRAVPERDDYRFFIPELDRQQYEALFEPGTRMPRRALLLDRIAIALLRARRCNLLVAVLVFSDIQSRAGTCALDLERVARVLQSELRPDDTVARAGDSALVLVCNTIKADEDARLIAHRLLETAGIACRVEITFSGEQQDAEMFLTRALEHLSSS